ncbi:YeeE/YedE thiosulfate transporter family protein [Polymorphum gilvum]|uniref:YeeE/YedE family protein n=1 Tax=Polymorphum gilvum (strain LMG 25793 / CGMCC 1.9160 / SL003B-26A1) TaxID=991905 RepID=F2J4Y5_POLGS|nr:YeeE/YedE thiosulfate transporter family protein [Polymorphum gilvum]ADZ70027.1 YeeE/YedE family protein [Polymorphum gilvum SL003B-26A1]
MDVLSRKSWSPYVAGIVIGLLQIPAFLLAGTALGASSSFVTAAAWVASIFDPAAAQIDYFAKHLVGAKNYWQAAMVIGIGLGAYLSARASGTRRASFAPSWTGYTGIRSLAGRLAMGFVGGFVLLVGARIADGCTSGHGISGMAQLAVGSTVAVAAMFVGGIAISMLFRKV